MRITPCASCKGQRLKPTSLAVTVADKNIYEITNMPILDLQDFLQNMKLSERQLAIGSQILKEIRSRRFRAVRHKESDLQPRLVRGL